MADVVTSIAAMKALEKLLRSIAAFEHRNRAAGKQVGG
jgi:hypothetical protein